MQKPLNLIGAALPIGALFFALRAIEATQEEAFKSAAGSLGTDNQGDDLNRVFSQEGRDFSLMFDRFSGGFVVKGPASVTLSTPLPLDIPFVLIRQSEGAPFGFADVEFDRGLADRLLDDPSLKARVKVLFELGAVSVRLDARRLEVYWVGGLFRGPVNEDRLKSAVPELAALASGLLLRQLPPAGPPGREPSIGDGLAPQRLLGSAFGAWLGAFFGLLISYGLPSLPFEPAVRFRFAAGSLAVSVPLIVATYVGLERAYLRRSPLPEILVIPVWFAIAAVITASCLAAEAVIRR